MLGLAAAPAVDARLTMGEPQLQLPQSGHCLSQMQVLS